MQERFPLLANRRPIRKRRQCYAPRSTEIPKTGREIFETSLQSIVSTKHHPEEPVFFSGRVIKSTFPPSKRTTTFSDDLSKIRPTTNPVAFRKT